MKSTTYLIGEELKTIQDCNERIMAYCDALKVQSEYTADKDKAQRMDALAEDCLEFSVSSYSRAKRQEETIISWELREDICSDYSIPLDGEGDW